MVSHPEHALKGTVPQDFRLLVFLMIKFPPSTWVYVPLRPFQIFSKIRGDIRGLRCTTGVDGGKWKKSSIRKILGSKINIYINFCLQVHFKESAAWYCFHVLPPVSTTLVKLVAKFAAGVVDTSGKFATAVVDTASNLPPVVSLIRMVHLDLRISPRIFENIWNGLNWILWGWGKTDPWKKTRRKKSRDTVPLNVIH